MERLVPIIGFISAILTTAAFLPQTIKTWRTRSTTDLSPLMFVLFCIGITGWLIYGILIKDWPIILANMVTICLAGTIMYFIIRGQVNPEIEHLGLYVNDLEKMRSFYCNSFNARAGKKYENNSTNFSSYFLTFLSGARLEIMQSIGPVSPDNDRLPNHVSISVGSREGVDRLTEKFREQGISILSEPRLTGDGYYESIIADPEGNRIEITV